MRYLMLALGAIAASAQAHSAAVDNASGGEALVAALVIVAASAYGWGAYRLWRSAGVGRGLSVPQVLAFVAAWLASLIALEGPVVAIAGESFAAHMAQHETLMVIAAPLFVVGRPFAAWSWSLPASWRGRIAGATALRLAAVLWHGLTQPLTATVLQIIVVWLAHVPRVFDYAVSDPWTHALQHAAFFIAAIAFWTALLRHSNPLEGLAKTALVFVTMLGIGALGALLTFARAPWYDAYAATDSLRSLSRVDDQQLGGLLMWIPGGLPYIAAALWLLVRSLRFWPPRARPRATATAES